MVPSGAPTCFLSYTHENPPHTDWVFRLAVKLRDNGVDAKLDRWDCPPGCDLARFMISGVKNSDYVVLVCTPTYRDKAEQNRGGVGDEGTIIFGQLLLQSAADTKFIPVLRRGTPAEALPAYLSTRLFIDFRADTDFESSADQLIRHLHGLPIYFRPPLGRYLPSKSTYIYDVPKKWILVAGTGDRDDLPPELESVASFLGVELARNTFGLITGGWPGVDRAAVGAFSSFLNERKPLENFLIQVIPKRKNPRYSVGRIVTVPDGEEEYSELVKLADAAILIGGKGGTLKTGLWMRHLGKPVLPVASTGGDAEMFHKTASQLWVPTTLPNASLDDFLGLAGRSPGVIESVVHLLDRWAGNT